MTTRVLRDSLMAALAAVSLLLSPGGAWSQDYPGKVVREQDVRPE